MNGEAIASSPNRKQQPKLAVGPRLCVQRDAVFLLLKELAAENREHFNETRSKSAYHQRILDCCVEVDQSVGLISGLVQIIQVAAIKCDYDEKTPGNGFRSLICLCDMVILHLISVLKRCNDTRADGQFRAATVCKDLETYAAILRFFVLCFQQVVMMIESMDEGSLFPSLEGDYSIHNGIFKAIENLDASCFYGRSLGSQFSPSVTLIFNVIGIALTTYSLSWSSATAALGSLFNNSRYLLSPEQRAKHIIKVIRDANIEFCRAFWNLSEIPPPKLFCPAMEFYRVSHVPMSGPLTLESKHPNTLITVEEPKSHGPPAPICMRILSAKNREGLSTRGKLEPLSPNLVIHCHGGGYVATSSKSHETYLRLWAKYLNCPIVSIDYSLSPEFPYPRPTEEVLYTYAWILQNPHKFGWTGEKVIMVGDSAGGNLVFSVTLKLIELNAKRLPDAVVPIYTPFLFQYLPSPSRVLSFSDPLLHMGVVIRCAAAYTGAYPQGTESEISQRANSKIVGHKSLTEYVNEMKSKHAIDVDDYSFGNQSMLTLASLPPDGDVSFKDADTEKDTTKNGLQDKRNGGNMDDSENREVKELDATIQIDQDSSHICLSASNYDHALIRYLKNHPLTASSTEINSDGQQLLDDVFDSNEMLCEYVMETGEDGQLKYTAKCVAQRITLPGDEPPISIIKEKKTPSLSRSVIHSVTSSVTSAFETISHFIDSNKHPVGHDDRTKLDHASKVGFREAAKLEQQEAEKVDTVLAELMKLNLPRESLISPMYTSGEVLRQLPPVYFIACHLDPLLDDTITFAKKLRAAGGRIRSLDLLHGLPHGFLNFAPMSDDCYEGARICMRRIEEALNAE